MGNREDLLIGAKKCLAKKGYARTTARDIVAASGANLASIGYHFGSKEALLNAALVEAIDEWGQELERALSAAADIPADPLERFERTWGIIVELFSQHRQLWAANFEVLAQVEYMPAVRKVLIEANERARPGLAALFQGTDPAAGEGTSYAVGTLYQAMLTGVMSQWLIDPATAPSAHDLTVGFRTILAAANAGNGMDAVAAVGD